jgi:hypothetical protein
MNSLFNRARLRNKTVIGKPWICLIISILFLSHKSFAQEGYLIPTDATQKNFLKAYHLIFHSANNDFHKESIIQDTSLFTRYGEFSTYWITSGSAKGSFVYPDSLEEQSNLTNTPYSSTYNWQNQTHLSVQYKATPKTIAIFHSNILVNNFTINWEAPIFRSMFNTFLENDTWYYLNETQVLSGINDSTSLLIIPSFNGEKSYIDSMIGIYPNMGTNIKSFLARGGTIYAEGNGAYFLEAIGVFSSGSVNYNNKLDASSNYIALNEAANHPIGFASATLGNTVYSSSIPYVSQSGISVISSAATDSRPVIFTLEGTNANGGRIICNLGLPTSGGMASVENGSRQLQWTFNTLLYAFSSKIDLSRSVKNSFNSSIIANSNSVAYDRLDTFKVKMVVRNLSDESISSVSITEDLRGFFKFMDISSSVPYTLNGNKLTFTLSLSAKSEQIVWLTLRCPDTESSAYENVDKYIDYDTYLPASLNTTSYSDAEGLHSFYKKRNYADIMFSARIVADADVNWKNFLGLEYQPFKVFMIMENKERTQAANTVYTQYIPKDVPFYWSDKSINIPILQTPGGKYVDILRGSDDQNNPEYDLDSDGKPDVWLDTASIYPKGYILTEDSVYWANPWEHLRTGNDSIVFEDIDHDGKVARDTNGDGIVDIEEPGDKIRVWKITWNIGTVNGYDYFDPYCSYEVWVDPPDLVKLSAGVAHVYGTLKEDVDGMFYPYTPDISKADKNDTHWTRWMESDGTNPVGKQFIYQTIQNYQGYTFIDTAAEHYTLKPYDKCVGTVPQPHEEFLAVVSMGGEEIDMYHPTPAQSLYSKINYKTMFNEDRVTPIRTTYTYYAPLPNPLQFEYLASTYSIKDTLGNKLNYLPAYGKAKLKFDVDASTEYSYYWIRNFGYPTDRKPDWIKDNSSATGNGVFGYMIYEIPKGLGGYKITLPVNADGTYNTDSIVQVDGKPFSTWITNENTGNAIEVWEDESNYQIYIPQVLVPPAVDDDNHDGIDDWIDDAGDRFQSSTGFLHDPFMIGNGEDYPNSPSTPFEDTGYGTVTSGWSSGADGTYGDDNFETLGRTNFTINAIYEGKGKEGPVDISKGATLVVEEIFGGSPWVINSHVLPGYAKGVKYKLTSEVTPKTVKYGTDTVYIKHTIEDLNEPHEFNSNFDPYHISLGYDESAITALAGGKDPCSLIDPVINTTTIIDPDTDHKTITLVPDADGTNSDLTGYPRTAEGTFLEVKIEIANRTADNWYNTTIKPVLTGLGKTKVEMEYVAYPRPLVPSHVENGTVVSGDQPGTFTTGWRFNQPENEVLVKMGDTLNLIQPTRRAYFVILLKIDESLKNGIYPINFTIDGKKVNYKGTQNGSVSYAVPQVLFSITNKISEAKASVYQKFKIDTATLTELKVNGTSYFEGTKEVKYSVNDVDYTNYTSLTNTLPATYSDSVETIDMKKVAQLPNADSAKLYLLEKVIVNSYRGGEDIDLTTKQQLSYIHDNETQSVTSDKLVVSPYGPRILINQKLYSVNGVLVDDLYNIESTSDKQYAVTRLEIINAGNDVSENTVVKVHPGEAYTVLEDSLASNIKYTDGLISVNVGILAPGETKYAYIYYQFTNAANVEDLLTVIELSDIKYTGSATNSNFSYVDTTTVENIAKDLKLQSIAFSKESENKFAVTVYAQNRGIPVKNVWLRVYAVVGGVVIQYPIAEKEIETFNAGEIVSLDVEYTLPNNEEVKIYAKIDDDDNINEIIETNNDKYQLLVESSDVKEISDAGTISVYPNPFAEKVYFMYDLTQNMKDVKITIYNSKGSTIVILTNCAKDAGKHILEWSPENLPTGNYIYKIEFTGKNTGSSVASGIILKN